MVSRTQLCAAALLALLCSATIASADFRYSRQLKLQPGGTFTIGADGGSVEIIGIDSGPAQIFILSRDSDFGHYYEFKVDDQPSSTDVTLRRRNGWLESLLHGWWSSDRIGRIVVRVPRTTRLHVRTGGGPVSATHIASGVRLVTSGGGVRVDDLDGLVDLWTSGGPIEAANLRGDLSAHTSGGGIRVQHVRGQARVETSGGPIVMEDVTGAVSARTSGGGIRISEAGNRVDAHTSGGPLSVEFTSGNRFGGNLTSSGGGVIATVDPAVPLTIDATSGGGAVRSDSELQLLVRGALTRSAIRGDLNGGGATLRLRSSGGGVRIAALAPGQAAATPPQRRDARR